jgi:hypothetical protein
MHNKAMLGWPILLLSASCVPAAFGQQLAMSVAPVAAPAGTAARPGFQTISLPVAAEEPPPPEVMADEIAVGSPAKPFEIGPASTNDVRSALDCLTAAVYYEARSESEDGQRAVAQVVLNRVRHPAFPKSVCGVVYQGSNRATGCQFSFTCDGSLARGREPGPWDRARRLAAQALAGYVYEPVGLATHYHTTAIHPWWADALTKAVTIGAHVFYRWRGEWGDPKSFQRPYVGAEAFARAAAEPIGDRAEAPAETAFGVAVHRAAAPAVTLAEVDDGAPVRIHRTGAAARASEAPEGVRIHRSSNQDEAPALASADSASADSAPTR